MSNFVVNPNNTKVAEWTPEGLSLEANKAITSKEDLILGDPKAGINTLSQLADKIKESLGRGRGDMIVFTAPGTAIILPAPSEPNMILVSEPSTETGLQWKRITEVLGQ